MIRIAVKQRTIISIRFLLSCLMMMKKISLKVIGQVFLKAIAWNLKWLVMFTQSWPKWRSTHFFGQFLVGTSGTPEKDSWRPCPFDDKAFWRISRGHRAWRMSCFFISQNFPIKSFRKIFPSCRRIISFNTSFEFLFLKVSYLIQPLYRRCRELFWKYRQGIIDIQIIILDSLGLLTCLKTRGVFKKSQMLLNSSNNKRAFIPQQRVDLRLYSFSHIYDVATCKGRPARTNPTSSAGGERKLTPVESLADRKKERNEKQEKYYR